ncbi:predicted protein [Plenodomus lingam JN3]|uniref:Predicted protein n=1 Tax=Leptosphaeria maculans (strain JN3 / isolate v23.1.3 / race Av1-4-5-6-7-8) TaxID=985895 RepID=E4ZSW7_LEPMJ|nr:predicted protein [Plenodomus lingam JN3]CBX94555.1 predicted protein [Plenodomus lingam JN3]
MYMCVHVCICVRDERRPSFHSTQQTKNFAQKRKKTVKKAPGLYAKEKQPGKGQATYEL